MLVDNFLAYPLAQNHQGIVHFANAPFQQNMVSIVWYIARNLQYSVFFSYYKQRKYGNPRLVASWGQRYSHRSGPSSLKCAEFPFNSFSRGYGPWRAWGLRVWLLSQRLKGKNLRLKVWLDLTQILNPFRVVRHWRNMRVRIVSFTLLKPVSNNRSKGNTLLFRHCFPFCY